MGVFVGVVLGFFASVGIGLLFSIPAAWIIMLILGAFHATYPAVPALSFWLSLLLTFGITILFKDASSSSD